MSSIPLRHGIFMAPYHTTRESPTVAMRRDIELVQWLDQLGFDEAWFGEHHSSGFETIASPELMIAATAEVTRRIKLGTGVVSLPYHNPLMVANRILQLDHLTMGRTMFGAGPGLLPTDAMMQGIDIKKQRDMMVEALEVILRLFRGEEVTVKTDWFTLDRARAHILPYSHPYPETVVASAVTPSGGSLAGKLDLGMLCVAATQTEGFDVLAQNWRIANEVAAEHGRTMDPRRLRLVAPVHIAETREKARENVQYGIEQWCEYFDRAQPRGLSNLRSSGDPVDLLVNSGRAVIGTPDDAIEMIERLQAKQGEFGVFLNQTNDWADWEANKKSFELYARFVIPHFNGSNRNRERSFERLVEELDTVAQDRADAVALAFNKYGDRVQKPE